jgi:CBS domain-containing protein
LAGPPVPGSGTVFARITFSILDPISRRRSLMNIVRQLLQSKGGEVWSTTPGTSVYDALKLMADKNIGSLVVLDGERLVGIFSERDYARKVILKGKTSRELSVADIMTSHVVSVRPDQTIGNCMELMTEHRVRHLPVLESGRVVGVISIGDVVKSIISDQQDTIAHLQEYITGRR